MDQKAAAADLCGDGSLRAMQCAGDARRNYSGKPVIPQRDNRTYTIRATQRTMIVIAATSLFKICLR